jgi:hypothetical protein
VAYLSLLHLLDLIFQQRLPLCIKFLIVLGYVIACCRCVIFTSFNILQRPLIFKCIHRRRGLVLAIDSLAHLSDGFRLKFFLNDHHLFRHNFFLCLLRRLVGLSRTGKNVLKIVPGGPCCLFPKRDSFSFKSNKLYLSLGSLYKSFCQSCVSYCALHLGRGVHFAAALIGGFNSAVKYSALIKVYKLRNIQHSVFALLIYF